MMQYDELAGEIANLNRRTESLEQQVKVLSGPHVELVATSLDPQGQESSPHADIVVAEGPPPGSSVADWISSLGGSPGFVLDPGLARATPCIEVELEGRSSLVYSRGIMGALDEEQQALYCAEGRVPKTLSPEDKARVLLMEQTAASCSQEIRDAEMPDQLGAYLSCMGQELRAKGLPLW